MAKELKDMSSDELKEWKALQNWEDAEPGTVDRLDAVIMQKMVDEKVSVAMHKVRADEVGKKSDTQALKDWPELNDEKSEMYKRVREELDSDPRAKEDPKAFRRIATEVGLDMGLTPAGFTPTKRSAGDPMEGVGAGEGVAGGREGTDPGTEFLDRTSKIGEAFGDLLDLRDDKVRDSIKARVEGDETNG